MTSELPPLGALEAFLARAACLPARQAAEAARADQEARWRRGEEVPAERYLDGLPAVAASPEDALVVIYGELLLGGARKADRLGRIRERYPHLAGHLSALEELHAALLAEGKQAPADGAAGEAPSSHSLAYPSTTPDAQRPTPPLPSPVPSIPGYEVVRLIGQGGMGAVWEARHLALGRAVALKVIRSAELAGSEELVRFLMEAEALAAVEHPHVVRVYDVGRAGSQPYMALEYVAGGTLADRLRAGPLAAGEAARLLEQLARGVQAAHQRGIVHRDLKPGNVLLASPAVSAPAGETPFSQQPPAGADAAGLAECLAKVTDFGLARRVEAGAGLTQTGVVMGTPSYMAPEQARGDSKRVGPAADVYGLGAILYECLTGRAPFVGPAAVDVLMQVVSDEPVAVRALAPKVPRDLETISLKALHKEPARRYASAAELAEDLRRFQAGEPITARPVGAVGRTWRWARRKPMHAAMVAVCALGTLAFVAGALWHNTSLNQALKDTQEQRDVARANLGVALDTVKSLLAEVGSEHLKDVPEMAPVRQALLEKALAFCQEIATRNDQDPGARRQTALAHQRVGDIYTLMRRYGDAEAAFEQAEQMLAQLTEEFPDQPTYRADLAGSHVGRAGLRYRRERPGEAVEAAQASLQLWERLLQEQPGADDHLDGLATANNILGVSYTLMGKSTEAIAALENARAGFQQLAKRKGGSASYEMKVGAARHNLGRLYGFQGKAKEAEESLRGAVAIGQSLLARAPGTTEYQKNLARSREALGELYRQVGRNDEAAEAFHQAAKEYEGLARRHPTVPEYTVEQAGALNELGLALALHRDPGQRDKAPGAYEQTLALLEPLRASRGDDVRCKTLLAWAYQGLAWSHQTKRDLAKAKELYAQAIPLREEVVRAAPGVLYAKQQLAQVYHQVGMLHSKLKEPAERDAAYQKALAIRTELVEKHPDMVDLLPDLAWTLNNLASISAERGQYADALRKYARALEIWARLAAKSPTITNVHQLADAHRRIGRVHEEAGTKDAAEKSYREWARLRDELASKNPNDVPLAGEAGIAHGGLAEYLLGCGKPTEALASCARAAAWYDAVRKKAPKDALLRQNERINLSTRGLALARLGRMPESLAAWERCLELADDKTRPVYRLGRARALAEGGDHGRAAAEAEEVAGKSARDGDHCFWAAVAFAACRSAAERDAKLPSAERSALARKYTDRAVELLRKAREAGYFATQSNRRRLTLNDALNALRSSKEFEAFLRESGLAK